MGLRLLITTLALGLLACSSADVNTDYDRVVDFGGYTTWNWVPGTSAIQNPVINKQIQAAIRSTLEAKGYPMSASPDDATMLIAYSGHRENSVDVWQNDYYSRPGYFAGTPTNEYQYTEGTLIIDVVDGKNHDMVWRGSASAIIASEVTEEEINGAVNQILKTFPPEAR